MMKRMDDPMTKDSMLLRDILPAGIARFCVRGLVASNFASAHRLMVIAAVRAKNIQMMMSKI